MSLQVAKLRAMLQTCDRARVAEVSAKLLPLFKADRDSMPMDADYVRHISPKAFDVMLTDIHESDIAMICEMLGKELASEADCLHVNPVECIMYGEHCRVFCMLPVVKSSNAIWVPFLYDTGAPFTYISRDVFAALGIQNPHDDRAFVTLNGERMVANVSHDVCVLGQDYMRKVLAKASLDYPDMSGQLVIAKKVTRRCGDRTDRAN